MSDKEEYEWDKDTEEIRSLDSEVLHETRPNRWTGTESAWRHLTAEDRQAHAALIAVRNRDLAVHLFNAFSLRQQGLSRDASPEDEGDGEQSRDKAWTAWPMRLDDVPSEDFMRTEGDDSETTFRRLPSPNPAGELEEEISAAVLRFAKERFWRRQRQLQGEEDDDEEEAEIDEGAVTSVEDSNTETRARSVESGGIGSHQGADADEEVGELETSEDNAMSDTSEEASGSRAPVLRAAVSADDESSYDMLRPTVRHMLTKLDKTLMILHNTRMATFTYMSDPDSGEEAAKAAEVFSPPRNRPKRKLSTGGEERHQERLGRQKRRGPGRPPQVHTPREGETEREMLKRVAREKHQRIPIFSDEENDTSASQKSGPSRSRRRKPEPAPDPPIDSEPSPEPASQAEDPEEKVERLGLRDWRDVLGAAAMAGFSSKVIARASQRCANLFGQRIEFKTLAEYPAAHGTRRMHTARYGPGEMLSSEDEAEDEDEAAMTEIEQRRAVSRSSSVALGSSSSDDVEGKTTARQRGQKRRTNMTTIGQLYCPHAGCSRAMQGFNRKSNLNRHLDTIHGKGAATGAILSDDEDGDEVHGAVHVDGFLKPIKMRKGWREGDTKPRQPLKRGHGRRASRRPSPNPDDGYTAERGDDDFIKKEAGEEHVQ